MSDIIYNKDLIPHNMCIGCGHDNPRGFKIEIKKDPEHGDQIIGTLNPDSEMIGFPGITHGGVIFTTLDCMSSWAPRILRPHVIGFWVLRSANVKYHQPPIQGKPITLTAKILEEGDDWDAKVIYLEAKDSDGNVLVTGENKVIPLNTERFLKLTGMKEVPEEYQKFLSVVI